MSGSLTPDQIDAYRRDGFLCPLPVFDAEETQGHRAVFEGLETRFADTLPRPVSDYCRTNSHIVIEQARQIATDDRVLDAVESVLGPDLMLWSVEYFIKEPGTDKVVSWHQDITYWGMGETDHEVTAWLALSPASNEAGCMRFVPGSHQSSVVDHRDTFAEDNLLSRGQEIAVDVDEADAVVAALKPGEMSLHHGRLFHASGPNTTDDRRIGCVMRFIRPDTPATGKGRDYAMLVRGCDRSMSRVNMVPPAGNFSTAALTLYEEVLCAQAATLTEGAVETVGQYEPQQAVG
ncbi:MAG: phytanoyl-CoA dioxygenase family protein [Pseudomonadota bacterium]